MYYYVASIGLFLCLIVSISLIQAALLADSIMGIPYIESIDVADNNLTDAGLGKYMHRW